MHTVTWQNFNNQAKFNTWITRILINECILRKKKLLNRQKVINARGSNDIVTHTPLNDVMNKELKGLLETAVSALPEQIPHGICNARNRGYEHAGNHGSTGY